MRGLQATRSVQEGETLLSLPRTHVLTVWDSLHLKARRHSWCKYTLAFQQQWQVKMPPALLEVLSGAGALQGRRLTVTGDSAPAHSCAIRQEH
jgi:hypothetical protein